MTKVNKNTLGMKSGTAKKTVVIKGLIRECSQGLCNDSTLWDEKLRPARRSIHSVVIEFRMMSTLMCSKL